MWMEENERIHKAPQQKKINGHGEQEKKNMQKK